MKSIQDQLSDFQAHLVNFDVAVDVEEGYTYEHGYDSPRRVDARTDDEEDTVRKEREKEKECKKATLRGVLDEKEAQWWAKWRRRVKQEGRRAVQEAALLRGEKKRRKEGGGSVGIGRKRVVGQRKRRKLVRLAEGDHEYDIDGDVDMGMFADNELDDQDENEGNVIVEDGSGEEEDGEWKALGVDEIKVDEQTMLEEMRILINVRFSLGFLLFQICLRLKLSFHVFIRRKQLDIIVASIKLDDQFEWDLDNPMASPEEFAEVYTQELGLCGEFK